MASTGGLAIKVDDSGAVRRTEMFNEAYVSKQVRFNAVFYEYDRYFTQGDPALDIHIFSINEMQ